MPTINPDSWAYHPDFADIIVTKDGQVALRLLAAADIALCFARALVAKEYDEAAGMLAKSLKPSYPPDVLREKLEDMIWYEGDEHRWPTEIQVVTAANSSDVPVWRKQSNADDFGWVYVAINGTDYCEAVAVMITKEEGKLAIRDIEWGRP
jgi:hypothetical protein